MNDTEHFFYPIDDLEIRQTGRNRTLSGVFRTGRTATRSDRGRVRKERFSPGSLDYAINRWNDLQRKASESIQQTIEQGLGEIAAERDRIEQELDRANLFVLAGHQFDKPLGSTKAGNVRITSNRINLSFEVDLPEERNTPSYLSDLLKTIDARIVDVGVSPGFRVPPRSVVPNAEELVQDPGETVLTRQINQAVLKELSLVSSPNYAGTEVEVRHDQMDNTDIMRRYYLWL